MKEIASYTAANRLAWNAAAMVHQRHRGAKLREDFAKPGYSILDEHFMAALKEAGLAGAEIAHLCCNNGIELLSAVNSGAKSGIGFDISDVAIDEARDLARAGGIEAAFIATDVYDIGEEYEERFDQVWFTIGGLTWLPDLARIFLRAASMLRNGGSLLIYDMHPLTNMLAVPGEADFVDPLKLQYDYFRREPVISTNGIDYIGHTEYESPPSYDFPHSLEELLGGIADSGLQLRAFREFPHDISNLFGHLERRGGVPLSFILRADKP